MFLWFSFFFRQLTFSLQVNASFHFLLSLNQLNLNILLTLESNSTKFVLIPILGASGLHERLLINKIALTDANVRPVSNSLDSVNVTLDITFHGVINMVRVTAHLYCV